MSTAVHEVQEWWERDPGSLASQRQAQIEIDLILSWREGGIQEDGFDLDGDFLPFTGRGFAIADVDTLAASITGDNKAHISLHCGMMPC